MTPDIIKAIADLLATIEACHEKADDGYVQTADPEWQKMADAGDALSVALGIGADTTWRETADAFRALARPSTVERLSAAVDEIERDTNAALLATITAAHAGDLGAASDAATCAFALLGLDSAFRVRVERPDVGLPEGWSTSNSVAFVGGVSYPAHGPPGNYVVLHVYTSGKTCWGQSGYATPAVYLYLLRAAGVVS